RTSGESLLSIINDILDFSKIEVGKMETEQVDFDLYQAVDDVVQLLAPRAHGKQIELACRVDDKLPSAVRGDPYRLRQVLTNLIANAVKFTDRGEVIVDVLRQDAGTIRFAVHDTGIGIPEHARDRLFQAFEQADGSTTRRFGGTGLGLAISKSLVQMMGGEIGVESEAGKGSTFWFQLRLEERPSGQPPGELALSGLRVLVVDGRLNSRDALRGLLACWQIRVDCAPSGHLSLDMLRAALSEGSPYRLAIIDSQLPDLGGLQLAGRIAEDPQLRATPVVLTMPMRQRLRNGPQ